MKKLLIPFSLLLVIVFISCGGKGSYYEQLSSDKPFSSRILDLNKTIDEVLAAEKGSLVQENITSLKYVYEIGKNDTYIVSYLFDEKGCYEIGVDGYFELEEDANNVVAGINTEMNQSKYKPASKDNYLNRWKNKDKSISIELDYKDTSRGLFLATIFANK